MSATVAFPIAKGLRAKGAARGNWRTFEVIRNPEALGATRICLPVPLMRETPFQKTLLNRFSTDGGTVRMVEAKADGLGIITAEFPAGVKPVLTLTNVAQKLHR
jgi:hypothetical protein